MPRYLRRNETEDTPSRTGRLQVLLVQERPVHGRTLVTALTQAGCEVRLECSVQVALEQLSRQKPGNLPEAVILDCSGGCCEVNAFLEGVNRQRFRGSVFVLSESIAREQSRSAIPHGTARNGMQAASEVYLQKPVPWKRLLSLLVMRTGRWDVLRNDASRSRETEHLMIR